MFRRQEGSRALRCRVVMYRRRVDSRDLSQDNQDRLAHRRVQWEIKGYRYRRQADSRVNNQDRTEILDDQGSPVFVRRWGNQERTE